MSTLYQMKSSDPNLFVKAYKLAEDFARPYMREEIIGIAFLGAIARGYFDASADIDLAIFSKKDTCLPVPEKFQKIEGIEIHCWWADYETELAGPWDMAKRWTFSEGKVYYDPTGSISQMLKEKVPLTADERKWLMMSGLTLSEWYVNRLTLLWLERGNIVSAHHMVDQGLNYFFDVLFGLNNRLVPDMKWRHYCAQQLQRLPVKFNLRMRQTMTLRAFSERDLRQRINGFMAMWKEMQPVVEAEVGMTFEEMVAVV